MTHEKVNLKLPDGTVVDAIAPVILSASRSTDIPAFHTEWFINRWKAGYSVWFNPYTGNPQFISYENVKGIVFWTKNPSKKIIDFQKELEAKGVHTYFQYTLNDYEDENFEPNLPPLSARIERFKELSQAVGKERVIWRFDPLMIVPKLIDRVENIGEQLKGYTDKLVFSFIDIAGYKKVQTNLVKFNVYNKDNVLNGEFTPEYMEIAASKLAALRDKWVNEGWDIELTTCGEKVDLDKYNIQHNRCIDSERFKQIAKDDLDFIHYLDFGKTTKISHLTVKQWKDKGQRLECGCMFSKDIGRYNTCPHFCVYCYANSDRETVLANMEHKDNNSDSLC